MTSADKKLNQFLDGELDSHTCPVCYDLMEPPDKAPLLLFP